MLGYTVTRSEGHEGGGGIGVASVSLAHPCMAPGLLPAWGGGATWGQMGRLLSLGGHIADKDNVTGAARLQGDGVHPEMLKHIENGLEPQVLDPALALARWHCCLCSCSAPAQSSPSPSICPLTLASVSARRSTRTCS